MANNNAPGADDQQLIESLIYDLSYPRLREDALSELYQAASFYCLALTWFCGAALNLLKRGMYKDLALLLWYSFGTVTILLQEILKVYPTVFSPTTLPASTSSRACNALALLQTIASHPETRIPFIRAQLSMYFYPFLDCRNSGNGFEYLRLTSLGILGALVKVDDMEVEVINFLLQSEVIPLCLQIMEMGSELSKVVATYIIEKILLNDAGLKFVCASVDRFFTLTDVLANMIAAQVNQPRIKIVKHVIRCYLRLTYHSMALIALRIHSPQALKDGTFDNLLRNDPEAVQWLQQLLDRLNAGGTEGASVSGAGAPAGGSAAWGGAPPPVPDDAAGGSGSAGGDIATGLFFLGNNIWAWDMPV